MSNSPDHDERVIFAQWEKMGAEKLRELMASGGLPAQLNALAVKWLAEKDLEAARPKAASPPPPADSAPPADAIAPTAADVADHAVVTIERLTIAVERANRRATIALVVAALSMIATAIGIGIVLWSSTAGGLR